jgi:putative hemolysin
MEFFFLLFLIVLNGFFAMSEIALVTSRSGRLTRLAEQGDESAALALSLKAEPTRVLSTIQIGITAIGILNGIVGESVLAVPLAKTMISFGLERRISEISSTVFVVMLITYLSIVIGELVPKRIGQFHAEFVARVVSRPISIVSIVSSPFVKLLSYSTESLLSLLISNVDEEPEVTEADIEAMVDEGSNAGSIATQERDLVKNVFKLDERPIRSIMVPAVDIIYIDTTGDENGIREILVDSDFSRYPVCEGGLGQLVGVASAKKLLDQMLETGHVDPKRDLEPVELIPLSLTGIEILERFRIGEHSMAFVVDEYGEVIGMVTVQDLLEILAGEFGPADAENASAYLREDGTWVLDGLLAIQDLVERLEFDAFPGGKKPPYQTLSGMIMFLLEHMPTEGAICEWNGWKFEVLDLDGKRVDKVIATRIPPEATPEDQNGAENGE